MKNWNYIEGAKVGNASTGDFTNLINKALRVARENPEKASRMNEIIKFLKSAHNLPSERWQYHIDRLDKEISSAENKKTGNDTPWEYAHRKPKVINDDKTGAEEFFKQLSDDVKEREKKDDADIEKVGNFKTGTSQLKPGDKVMSFGKKGTVKEVIGENTDNIYGEPLIKVEFEDGTTKTIGEHYMRKVGNRTISKESEMSQELKNLLKQANPEWKDKVSFAFSHGFDIDENDFINAIKKDLQNKRTGNSAYDDGAKKGKEDKRKGKLITAAGFEYHAPGYSSLSFKEKEEYKKGYYSTNDLKKEDIYKWGNSTSDDKFAYVMREFDEGKLKTPDGKVVTDPAQAKAIAYSESKKTENGLARARKAMNADSVIKYKGFTIKYRPFSGKYYISSGPNDTYVGKYAYKEYSSEQDAKDAIDGLK